MENQLKYVGGKEARNIFGVHQRTLYQWDEKGWIDVIRTDSNKRLYNVYKYIEEKKCEKYNKNCEEILNNIEKNKK